MHGYYTSGGGSNYPWAGLPGTGNLLYSRSICEQQSQRANLVERWAWFPSGHWIEQQRTALESKITESGDKTCALTAPEISVTAFKLGVASESDSVRGSLRAGRGGAPPVLWDRFNEPRNKDLQCVSP
jgi:hypothetical protein